jgi:hypothetical protein
MPKLIKVNTNGTQQEYAGVTNSAGAGNAGDIPALDGNGKLDQTFLPTGIGQDAVTAVAGEALGAGDMVYFGAGGTVLKADATAIGKAARGYVTSAVSNGANATVFFDDSNPSLSALVPGTTYYLSATAGQVTATPPTTAGQIVQEIGFASSATNLRVNIQVPVIRA